MRLLSFFLQVLKPQLGEPEPRAIPICPSLQWANSEPINETADSYMWKRQRLLSLDMEDLRYFRELPVKSANDIFSNREDNAIRPLNIGAFFHGIILVLILSLVYFLLVRKLSRQRRRLSPRFLIRCCFAYWKRWQDRAAFAPQDSNVIVRHPQHYSRKFSGKSRSSWSSLKSSLHTSSTSLPDIYKKHIEK